MHNSGRRLNQFTLTINTFNVVLNLAVIKDAAVLIERIS